MVTLTRSSDPDSISISDGMRPVNLKTDLAPLADLIELVFADSMDSSGRAALREMRYLSKLGPTLPFLSRLNEGSLGINLGYVWMADNRLIGNVSVYPTTLPDDFGKQWIIANVGVHPDYQGRGIARKLMIASMQMIQRRKGNAAILQVDTKNHAARHLYRKLGFVEEREWTTWRRSGYSHVPEPASYGNVRIVRQRRSEWRDAMALAQVLRPQELGGLGWLRPLHKNQFKKSFLGNLGDWLNLRSTERLVIRNEDDQIAASLWIENVIAGRTHLTLLCEPLYAGVFDDALMNTAVRRFGRSALSIEHPADEISAGKLLENYRFTRQRTLVHMRWDT
ncbi:MAG: GNAT family N-acetyltransferase [Aggregatilineales bacterium]